MSGLPIAGGRERAAGQPRSGSRLGAVAFGVVLSLVAVEFALRIAPQVIAPKFLVLFEPGLRAEIASGAYPLQKDFRPVERDDGGPPLFAARPDTRIVSIDEVAGGLPRRTDELGFCNPPGRYDGHERLDLVTLGDSFTWCHAVLPEQAWPALVAGRTGLATYSLGRGGTGLYEYLQYLRVFGLAKHPRIVVMNVYGGNDLRDAEDYADYRDAVARGATPPSEEPPPVAPALLASPLGRHSYALNLALAVASSLAGKNARDWERTGVDLHYEVLLPGHAVAFNVENRDRDEVVTARRLEDGRASLDVWEPALRRFADLARANGFTGVLAYTPSAHIAYGGRVRFEDPSLAAPLVHLDDAQRVFLRDEAAALGLLFHDLTPDLQKASGHADESGLLYSPVHMHLSRRGNEVVAESMSRFLEDQGLAPRPAAD